MAGVELEKSVGLAGKPAAHSAEVVVTEASAARMAVGGTGKELEALAVLMAVLAEAVEAASPYVASAGSGLTGVGRSVAGWVEA
jgi:hypothetical protein